MRQMMTMSDAEQFVTRMMFLLTAPYIGYPGWGDEPSFWERHKERITFDRFAQHMKDPETELATEYEAMLYLSSASLAAPMSHDWGQVYFYLFTRIFPEQAKEIGNEVTELDPGQREDLARLRAWIFRVQMSHVKAKMRGASREEVGTEKKELEVMQPKLF